MSTTSPSPTRRELLAATAAAGAISMLPGTLHAAATGSDAIRPFQVNFPQEELDDLRRRVAATRWPERETVTDTTQGVQLATMKKLAQLLGDGLRVAQMRGRLKACRISSPRSMASTFISFTFVQARECVADHRHTWVARLDYRAAEGIEPLTDPTSHGGSALGCIPSRDPLDAGLRFFRKAGTTGWDPDRIARAWTVLMKRLGYTKFVAQGGDWGALSST